jgi:beta-aspartyl-dipeptidase (metallo-type)
MLLIRNANVYAPEALGIKDVLIANGKIVAIENHIDSHAAIASEWNAGGRILTPGFIDQHIHILGAGGKHGFSSITPELTLSEIVACGSTTVVGLLGTDGCTKNVRNLFSKAKALDQEGLSTYIFTGYYGLDPVYIMDSVQEDILFIDKVIGCKIAISDIRSSYPTALELVRILREVMVGGMIANKKGILHLHLGALKSKMDVLFELVEDYEFPIQYISPTHVARTKELFDEAIRFAKLGGMIDITTGASKYTAPYLAVLYALEQGVSIDKMTFSTDGNAGLDKRDESGKVVGVRRAPIDANLKEVVDLIQKGGLPIEKAIKLVTTNPAVNLGLANKGRIKVGCDADFCCFTNNMELNDVIAKGVLMMEDKTVLVKGNYEPEDQPWHVK